MPCRQDSSWEDWVTQAQSLSPIAVADRQGKLQPPGTHPKKPSQAVFIRIQNHETRKVSP